MSPAPRIFINSLPKSGSMYTVDRLKATFQLEHVRAHGGAFPRFQINPFDLQDCIRAGESNGRGCIFKGHQPPSHHNRIIFDAFFDGLVLNTRDPRQALLSWIHNVEHMKVDVYAALMGIPQDYFEWSWNEKLAWQIAYYYPLQLEWLEQWRIAITEQTLSTRILVTRFEDLKTDPVTHFNRICDFYDLPHLFEDDLPAPKRGESNYRKGATSEWRHAFDSQQQSILNEQLADELLDFFEWQRD